MQPSDLVVAVLALALVALLLKQTDAASAFPPEVKTYTEKEARKFLKNLNLEWAKKTNAYYLAKWDYETDISRRTLGQELKVSFEVAKFQKQQRKEAVKYPREKFADKDIKRQLGMYSKLGAPGLPDDKYVTNAASDLAVARRCNRDFACKPYEGKQPDDEYREKLHCWLRFRYGKNSTDTFHQLVELAQQAASLDSKFSDPRSPLPLKPLARTASNYPPTLYLIALPDYTDFTRYMLRNYEQDDLLDKMKLLVDGVHPLYKQLTAYCRHRLRQHYGPNSAPNGGFIPDHLIDDPLCKTDPVPRKPLDFPGALRAKGFTVRKIFFLPDEFYRSLNMTGVPDAVWDKSILESDANKTMSCKPVAQDFLDNKDYRIRVCGTVCEKTLFAASSLVTGVVYGMEMRSQPSVYRQTMNDAFVEGIGGLVALTTFGTILAFQMHRQLCIMAGLFDAEDPTRLPLHRCNLLNQPVVSNLLKKMMQVGGSKPWQEVLEQTIGTKELDPSAATTYFQPLHKFLEDHNVRTGEIVAWGKSQKECGLPRYKLMEKDADGAARGYYSCPLGEFSEEQDADTTAAPTAAPTTPAPTTVDATTPAPTAAPSAVTSAAASSGPPAAAVTTAASATSEQVTEQAPAA
ncbi:hypothetical protein FOCC_FOCC017380 [Frankliniella occidentalis]|nr:hypothetical protein FOCC_FOCC017380 [Frankliniella occidentalis]